MCQLCDQSDLDVLEQTKGLKLVHINARSSFNKLQEIYVTQHHQMRHKSHTKVLSKRQIKEEWSKS